MDWVEVTFRRRPFLFVFPLNRLLSRHRWGRDNCLGYSELYQNSWFLIIVEAQGTIIIIITLIIEESDPHLIRPPQVTFCKNRSGDAHTSNIRIIILNIFYDDHEFWVTLSWTIL